MALIGETGLLGNRGKRLLGPAHQRLCALEPPSHHVSLRANADRLFEGAAEMIRAETGYFGENCQSQPVIEMGFDVIPHPLQPLAGQAVRRLKLHSIPLPDHLARAPEENTYGHLSPGQGLLLGDKLGGTDGVDSSV